MSNQLKNCQPYLLAHWQASQTKLKPKLAKELTKPSLITAFKGGFGILLPAKNKIHSHSVATSVIDKIKY
jgi:hypothetical protein